MPDFSYLPQIALSGIGVGCIYGLIGIGFCVIYNASGIVNFAQGAFVMLGGMLTHIAFREPGLPLPVSALLAVLIVAGLGVIIGRDQNFAIAGFSMGGLIAGYMVAQCGARAQSLVLVGATGTGAPRDPMEPLI